MATIMAPNYKSPSCESRVGNLNADVIEYIYIGTEPDGTVLKLRKMSEFNTYLRITIIGNSGLNATTASINLGYLSREDGGSDDLTAFASGLDVQANTFNEQLVDVSKVPEKHDLALTIVSNNAANAGLGIKIIAEFVNVAG